jgi:hypothetical protein
VSGSICLRTAIFQNPEWTLWTHCTINKYFVKERIQSCRKTSRWKFSIHEAFSSI